jgi:CspA family cold shock protein
MNLVVACKPPITAIACEDVMTEERKNGTVKWFDNAKGYGFIISPEGEDVFVHYRAIVGEGYRSLTEGQQVEFVASQGEKGWQASEVATLS